MAQPAAELPTTAKRNIETIAKIEQALLRRRSVAERMGESVARFFGSLVFIAAHVLFFTVWIIVNTHGWQKIRPFDPYPFPFLSLVLGVEFICLTTFVLLNQKHQIRREEQWSHLHLQLSMLTEQEVTKTVLMLNAICKRLSLREAMSDEDLEELCKPKSVTAFVGEIEKSRDVGVPAGETIAEIERAVELHQE